jgi:hypothetical protein
VPNRARLLAVNGLSAQHRREHGCRRISHCDRVYPYHSAKHARSLLRSGTRDAACCAQRISRAQHRVKSDRELPWHCLPAVEP